MSNTKRHLISAGVTFVSTFLLAILPMLADPSWDWTGKAVWISILITGLRAAVKALWEKFGPELA